MLWGKKDDELPKELQGLTPEQIVEKLKAVGDSAARISELQASLAEKETTLGTLTQEQQQLKQKLEELEKNTPPKKIDGVDDDEPATLWSDPEAFIKNQTKSTELTALMAGMMSAKLYARQQMSTQDSTIFGRYEKEIDQVINSYHPQQRVMPQSWINALTYVKGLHMDEILKAQKDGTDFFAEPPTRGVEPPPAPEDKLSSDEEEMCRRMHWDPKQYLARRKAGRNIGGHVQYGV